MAEVVSKREMVILESPFGAPKADLIIRNVAYAMAAMRHSLAQGEAPFASHLLYTQMLDDTIPEERSEGIEAGLAIGEFASKSVVYEDLGISGGMQYGIDRAEREGRPVEFRRLYAAISDAVELDEAIRADSPLSPEAIAQIYTRMMAR